jgi:hypothetical protein
LGAWSKGPDEQIDVVRFIITSMRKQNNFVGIENDAILTIESRTRAIK